MMSKRYELEQWDCVLDGLYEKCGEVDHLDCWLKVNYFDCIDE